MKQWIGILVVLAFGVAGCGKPAEVQDEASKKSNDASGFLEQNDYTKAIEGFSEAIQLDSSRADLYYNRGMAYFNNKQYDEAIADMEQALSKDPNLVFAQYYAAESYSQKGDLDKAIEGFTNGINANPSQPMLHLGRGKAYQKKGQQAEADADFQQVKKMAPHLLEGMP